MKDPQYLPLDGTDGRAALVVKQARCAQRDGLAAGAELAAACGQDVLDPGTGFEPTTSGS